MMFIQEGDNFNSFENDINGTTVSNIKIIDGDAVVYEIARMISGENVTEQALSLARELIM